MSILLRVWGLALLGLVATALLGTAADTLRPRGIELLLDNDSSVYFDGTIRSFLKLDQRISWSGAESTFAAEAVLRPRLERRGEWGTWRARGEFFLNQPMGTLLSDPVRDLYREALETRPFDIFQLSLEYESENWRIRLGRIRTPLGHYPVPLLTNALVDAPFLRTEVLGFTETGMFVRWRPGLWSFDLGLSNGESNLDTNSTKALVARTGLEWRSLRFGIWLKAHDGAGSEQQKKFGSVYGVDTSVQFRRWTIYAEGSLDEHGLYRGDADPQTLRPLSFYHREVYRGRRAPVWGGGFHIGAMLTFADFWIDWNYGVYWPEPIGVPSHDEPIKRALIKMTWNVARHFDVYALAIAENSRPQRFLELYNNSPRAVLLGVKVEF